MSLSQPDGYLALPPAGSGPTVLVLHAWWGLNATIKSFCSRLAENGYLVFAPDLYHGKVADTIPGAEELGHALDANYQQAQVEVHQAAQYLQQRAGQTHRGIAVIGFSLGAFYALALAADYPDLVRAVVLFYGSGDMDLSRAQAAFLGHFAENDPYEPLANADALEQALKRYGRPVTLYRYMGVGHWFFEPDRTDAYNPAAANLAWERTLAFLQENAV